MHASHAFSAHLFDKVHARIFPSAHSCRITSAFGDSALLRFEDDALLLAVPLREDDFCFRGVLRASGFAKDQIIIFPHGHKRSQHGHSTVTSHFPSKNDGHNGHKFFYKGLRGSSLLIKFVTVVTVVTVDTFS